MGSIWSMRRSTERAERKPRRSQRLKGRLAESRQSSASGHSIACKIATPGSAFPRITPFLWNTGLLHFECWVRSTLNPVCVKNNSYLLSTNHDAQTNYPGEKNDASTYDHAKWSQEYTGTWMQLKPHQKLTEDTGKMSDGTLSPDSYIKEGILHMDHDWFVIRPSGACTTLVLCLVHFALSWSSYVCSKTALWMDLISFRGSGSMLIDHCVDQTQSYK